MNHFHIELIQDPQWVSYCVENQCSFTDNADGYVCSSHCSMHACSGSSCDMIKRMASERRPRTEESASPCPVTDLLVFHKPEPEFRSQYYMPGRDDGLEAGYGALECTSMQGTARSDAEEKQIVLKASLPAMTALFCTVLTERFLMEYEAVRGSRKAAGVSWGLACSPWMTMVLELAQEIESKPAPAPRCSRHTGAVVREAVLKSAAAMVTLFESCDGKIKRFVKKLACKYNDKHATRTEFHTMVVMMTLCLFPYLKHRVLSDLFDNRTLVLMCFDKTVTRHNQWSTLSTHVHLHVNQPEFARRVLSDGDLADSLPVVVTSTLDKYIWDAVCSERDVSMSRDQKAEKTVSSTHEPECEAKAGAKRGGVAPPCRRKRKTQGSASYYEAHDARLGQKVRCVREYSPYAPDM